MKDIVASRLEADRRCPRRWPLYGRRAGASRRHARRPYAGREEPADQRLSDAGRFKSLSEIKDTIEKAGIDLSKPVVTSCGSGVTAAVITLALTSLGHTDNTLYDGSCRNGVETRHAHRHGPGLIQMAATKKPKAIKAHITYLEMTAPPKAQLPVPANLHTAIMRAENIPLAYYRYLYKQVGARWHWVDRLRLSDKRWRPCCTARQAISAFSMSTARRRASMNCDTKAKRSSNSVTSA